MVEGRHPALAMYGFHGTFLSGQGTIACRGFADLNGGINQPSDLEIRVNSLNDIRLIGDLPQIGAFDLACEIKAI